MSRASAILDGQFRPPLVLIRHSPEQRALPILRYAIEKTLKAERPLLLVSVLHPPSVFIQDPDQWPSLHLMDLSAQPPNYMARKPEHNIFSSILERASQILGPLTVVFDSITTLVEDLGSSSRSYQLLKSLLADLSKRTTSGTLLLYVDQQCPLLPHIQSTLFCSSLTEIIVHSPSLILEADSTYLTPLPPRSSNERFWSVVLPMAARHEGCKLIFGRRGPGCSYEEAALEVVERLHGLRSFTGNTNQSVSRSIEGWSGGPCSIDKLKVLERLRTPERNARVSSDPDPSHGLSFNVALTPDQQTARSQVALPYLHQGLGSRHILYDPDSADDLDDDDPDEDLDL